MSEPKACKVCGEPACRIDNAYDGEPRAVCYNRKCWLYDKPFKFDEWNSRPIEDALNQRIAELQACIAKLDAYIIQVLRLLNNIECEYNGQVPYDELKPSLATIYKLLKEADNVSKIQRSND